MTHSRNAADSPPDGHRGRQAEPYVLRPVPQQGLEGGQQLHGAPPSRDVFPVPTGEWGHPPLPSAEAFASSESLKLSGCAGHGGEQQLHGAPPSRDVFPVPTGGWGHPPLPSAEAFASSESLKLSGCAGHGGRTAAPWRSSFSGCVPGFNGRMRTSAPTISGSIRLQRIVQIVRLCRTPQFLTPNSSFLILSSPG